MRFLVAALVLAGAASALAHSGASPSVNAPFQRPDVERWQSTLESESREVYAKRHEIVRMSGVERGMTVADVGAGTGLFTLLFARAVGPEGRVYATDIAPAFVQTIKKRAEAEGLRNVTALASTQSDTGLPEASVDLVFICDAYHHFEAPEALMRSIARAMKRAARLIVIDL